MPPVNTSADMYGQTPVATAPELTPPTDIIDPSTLVDPMDHLHPNDWPKQSDAGQYYGTPESDQHGGVTPGWEARNLRRMEFPWRATLSWDIGVPLRSFRIHVSCASSLSRIMEAIWIRYGRDQEAIEADGLHLYGGSYNYRLKRGDGTLSMHSYGCAIDLNPDANPMIKRPKDYNPQMPSAVIECFEAESWVWGGRWQGTVDGMHFQAAIV